MPCELLIRATTNGQWTKGYPVAVRDEAELASHPWGSQEGLPDFIILAISDATAEQVGTYLEKWKRGITYEILAENAQGWRIRIDINPKVRQLLGIDKAFRAELRDYFIGEWGASVHDYDDVNNEWATLDFPKPLIELSTGEERDLTYLREVGMSVIEEWLLPRLHYFDPADVDAVVAAGGKVTRTRDQVTAIIKSYLD